MAANTETQNPAVANAAINTRQVFFGENEEAALTFVDKHWSRIVCVGYVSEVVKTNEPTGWVISYAEAEKEVASHSLAGSFASKSTSSRKRS